MARQVNGLKVAYYYYSHKWHSIKLTPNNLLLNPYVDGALSILGKEEV